MVMIGIVEEMFCRISLIAVHPSMTGIWISISTTSNDSSLAGRLPPDHCSQ